MSLHVVKFKTELRAGIVPVDSRCDEIRHWAKIFHEKNLAPLVNGVSSGNFSFRLSPGANEFVVTASQMGYDKPIPNDGFVLVNSCDFVKGIVRAVGAREPSSESMLHWAIYNSRPEVNFIFHGHSPEILANSQKLNLVETLTQEPYGTAALADSVTKVLGDNNFVIMKGHGFVALGVSSDQVGDLALAVLAKV